MMTDDCRQDGVCALVLGCRRHWEERNRELVAERDDLRRRIAANAGRLSVREAPRWSHVADATGLGRTFARRVCSDVGIDPDEIVGGGA